MAQPDGVTFQAPRNTRIGAVIGIVVLALIVARVVYSAGWYATIGVLLVLGIIFNLWWIILRPKLVVGREGIEVVSGWQPATVAWKDVQRCEVSPKGTLLVLRGGQEVVSKFPAGGRAKDSDPPSEADRAAAYLAACVAWGKRGGSEPMPVYDH